MYVPIRTCAKQNDCRLSWLELFGFKGFFLPRKAIFDWSLQPSPAWFTIHRQMRLLNNVQTALWYVAGEDYINYCVLIWLYQILFQLGVDLYECVGAIKLMHGHSRHFDFCFFQCSSIMQPATLHCRDKVFQCSLPWPPPPPPPPPPPKKKK